MARGDHSDLITARYPDRRQSRADNEPQNSRNAAAPAPGS